MHVCLLHVQILLPRVKHCFTLVYVHSSTAYVYASTKSDLSNGFRDWCTTSWSVEVFFQKKVFLDLKKTFFTQVNKFFTMPCVHACMTVYVHACIYCDRVCAYMYEWSNGFRDWCTTLNFHRFFWSTYLLNKFTVLDFRARLNQTTLTLRVHV